MHVAAGLSFITSLIVLGVAYQQSVSYPREISAKVVLGVERGIAAEQADLSKKAEAAAKDPFFADAVLRKDSKKISSWIREERDKLGVSRLAVVDAEGFVISRTTTGYSNGDNLFLQHPFGRLIASGSDYTTSIESGVKDPRELFLIASAPIFVDGQRAGTLFVSNLANDDFAARFAPSYIDPDARIAFYRDIYGIYGSNIPDERSRDLLNANVQAASDRLLALTGAAIFRSSDGRVYLIKDVPLRGAESEVGGMIAFVPLTRLFWIMLSAVLLPLAVFVVFCMILHHRSRQRPKERLYYLAASLLGVTGMIITVAIAFSLIRHIPRLVDSHYPLYNSLLSLRPESSVFDANIGQKVSVVLDSGGEAINAISVKLIYDPKMIDIEGVDTAHSLCEYFLTDDYDKKGLIDLECVIPSPGFRGREANVADIYVKARREGSTSLVFADDSQVLANDGLGTDVLRQAIGGSFVFEDRSSAASASSTLSAFCGSHPNPERWYPERSTSIFWSPRVPVSIEMKAPNGSKTTRVFSMPPALITLPVDGEYGFVISSLDAKEDMSSAIRVRADSTPPEDVSLEASATFVKAGSIVRFIASAHDSGSGLQRASYMKINDDLFFPIGKEVHIPFPDPGVYEVTLRAYDNAGNFKDAVVSIEVVK